MSDIVPVDVEAESTINSVTAFEEGAQVFRVSTVNIGKGISRVIFRDLPTTLNRDTLQVALRASKAIPESVLSSIVLKGIGVETVTTENPTYDQDLSQGAEIGKQLEQIDQELTALNDEVDRENKMSNFMENAFEKVVVPNTQEEDSDLCDPAMWEALINQRLDTKAKGLEETRQLKLKLEELRAKRQQLAELRRGYIAPPKFLNREAVTVMLSAPQAVSELQLQLSYTVTEAAWVPAYDVRVDSEKSNLVIQYNGCVTQWTGECWNDVRIELSTAKPHISSDQPTLVPWKLHLAPKIRLSSSVERKSRSFMPHSAVREEMASYGEELEEEDERCSGAPLIVPEAQITESAVSQVFTVVGTHSVNNNKKEVRLPLVQVPLEATFSFVTVPKVDTVAFTQAEVKNSSDFFFLPGSSSIFLNEQFLARSSIGKVAPGETFKVDVGRDDAVVVTRKRIHRVKSEEGGMLTSKKTKFEHTFLITVTNRKSREIEVTIKEAVPFSADGDISVKLLQPEFAEGQKKLGPSMTMSDDHVLSDKVQIKPGAKASLTLAYRITYPEGRRLDCEL